MTSVHRRAVGIFPDRPKTASALQALSDSSFSMSHVTVIARDHKRENDIAGIEVQGEVSNQADTGGTVGAVAGGILGGATGLLVGLGTIAIPGIGPALLAGEAAALLTTLIGGAAGVAAGGLLGALIGLGIPEHRAKRYRDRVADGNYLVMLKESEAEIARAERTLKAAGIQDWGVYEIPKDSHQPSQEVPYNSNGKESSARHTHPIHDEPNQARRSRADETAQSDRRSDPQQHDKALHAASLPHGSNPVETADKQDVSIKSLNRHDSHSTDDFITANDNVSTKTINNASANAEQRAIGVFQSQNRMEEALSQLKKTGFPLHTVSILVRESKSTLPTESQSHSNHPLAGAANVMSGVEQLNLPQIGSTLIMGPDADSLNAALHEGKLYSFVDMLEHLGLARETANLYSRCLDEGAYLVTLKGQKQDVLHAASTLGNYGMSDWGIYDAYRQ